MQRYAGIGARDTPPEVLVQMTTIARIAAEDGWLLRSGRAGGADSAFELGCDRANGKKEIWLPWRGFNQSKSPHYLVTGTAQCDQALAIAASLHPAWERCKRAARLLHARNVLQILGGDFHTPVDRVICWTPNSAICGGTATALRLAQQYDIESVNLANC